MNTNNKYRVLILKKSSFFQPKRVLRCVANHLFLFLLFFINTISAQKPQNISTLTGKELHNRVRLQFLPIKMPTNVYQNLKNTMGVLGIHYQIPISTSFYGGVAMYTAVTGDQGGLFTLGAEIGYQKKFFNNFFLDTNFHFGGGGGYRYLVNDGAFINPNIGLKYKYNDFSIGVQFSHYNFYTGKIKSNTISFFVEIPSILRFTTIANSRKKSIQNKLTSKGFWIKPATKNAQIVRFDFLFPRGKSKKDNLEPLQNTLYVLGFEYQKYVHKNSFLFIHSDAIYKGLRAGFMDLFLGIGYHPYQSKYINLFTKLGIGAAGGRIAPEGGLTLYPSIGFEIKATRTFSVNSHIGYYKALAGNFEAYTLGFGLKYNSFNGGTSFESEKFTHFYTQGIWVSLQNQSYFKVQKTDNSSVNLQLLALQFQIDISKNFYFIGEAGFAYAGKSGGYAQGLAGIGIKSPSFIKKKLHFFLENVAGAGGGAGVDTGEGIVARTTLGINYKITENISFFASGGKIIAIYGGLNVKNINIGFSFGLSSLSTIIK